VPQPWTKKIRVLAVIPAGRGVAYATRQVASLVGIGLEVRTFFLLSRTSLPVLVKEYKRLRCEIRQFRPHLLHAHYGTMTSFLCAAVFAAAPLVITFRGSDLNRDPEAGFPRSFLGRLLSRISCLRGKRIICVTRQLRDRLWWGRSRTVVIPDGIDLRLFRPQPKDRARKLLGWEQGTRVVVFHGGNRPRLKGLHFVRAAVGFAEKNLGPIELMNLDGSVPPELVPCYLNAADCLALASVSEGSPNIVKEALACNLPVVATDVGDVAERLNGIQPSTIARRDVSEFGTALTELLLENRLSNGREHVENLALVHIAEAIRSVYEAVVQTRAK
jgi:glycosyltransferase involved in cell wall biosynthesis